MIHTTLVQLPPSEVLERAKVFFAERVPHMAAFVEKEGPTFLVLRGQGGEEVVFSATPAAPETPAEADQQTPGPMSRVRASTLLFDQPLDRFFSTLPLAARVEVR
jgi:hypothetical protein